MFKFWKRRKKKAGETVMPVPPVPTIPPVQPRSPEFDGQGAPGERPEIPPWIYNMPAGVPAEPREPKTIVPENRTPEHRRPPEHEPPRLAGVPVARDRWKPRNMLDDDTTGRIEWSDDFLRVDPYTQQPQSDVEVPVQVSPEAYEPITGYMVINPEFEKKQSVNPETKEHGMAQKLREQLRARCEHGNETPWHCSVCGRQNVTTMFCPNCGYRKMSDPSR